MNRSPLPPLLVPTLLLLLASLGSAGLAPGPDPAGRALGGGDVDVRAQYDPACFFVYGMEQDTGHLYTVSLANGFGAGRTALPLAQPPPELQLRGPDALAFDPTTDRLYFADAGEEGTSTLHYYDVHADAFGTAGELRGRAAGATFHEGAYAYVDQGTDELRRVFLAGDGTVRAEATMADFGLDAGMIVEDVTVLDDLLYGSTSGGEVGARFFVYDLDRDAFQTVSTASATYLQLAFANDRGLTTLYGVGTHDGVFYEIDHGPWAEGATSLLEVDSDVPFVDLAEGPPC